MAPSLNSVLVTALALAASTSALPSTTPVDKHYTIEQVKNDKFVRNGPLALARAYIKYGAPLPPNLANAVDKIKNQRRSTGSAATTPEQYDSEYLTPVQIGTPAQTLNLDFDTGSSDLWVFSSETVKSQVNGQTLYDPSKSSTSKKLSGATWSIKYGDKSTSSGDVYTDTVTVGGLTVSKQAVELAQTVSSSFTKEGNLDGLLGLAFSSINTVKPTQQKTFFDSAKSSLTAGLFTADLKHNAPGKYNFGYIDKSAYTGSIAYTKVDSSQGFWGFTSPGYAVGDSDGTSGSIRGIADTGTTLLLLPDEIINDYYGQVDGAQDDQDAGGITYPCKTQLPDFSFIVNNSWITIPGNLMNYAPIEEGSSTCYGGLQSSTEIGVNIFGDIALKAAFVVFDGTNNRLGWASKKL